MSNPVDAAKKWLAEESNGTTADGHIADLLVEIERLQAARDACEEQYQNKVNEIIGHLNEIDRIRDLLRRYIAHVGDCEGINFITHRGHYPKPMFTPAEIEELTKLADEEGV